MDSESPDDIFNSFTAATKEEWKKAAQLELDGADPFNKLAFNKGGLACLPYYDRQDLPSKDRFQLQSSANEFLGARAWYNMTAIEVRNESDSNQKAMSDLNSGSDGILFDLKNETTNISRLLNGIEWPYCALSFSGIVTDEVLKSLHDFVLEKKYEVTNLTGCAFSGKPFAPETLKLFEKWNHFHPLGIVIEKNELAANEIAESLAKAARQIDSLTEKGLSVKHVLQAHAFQFETGTDFFLDIAKQKVLRTLWRTVSNSFDAQSNVPIFIHCTSSVWNKKEYQPNGNMLKSTTTAISAILGGCDSLTIIPEDQSNTMMARVARNVSSVLREESHLSKVADPTAGSYYLETLIDQLAESAWKKFKEMM